MRTRRDPPGATFTEPLHLRALRALCASASSARYFVVLWLPLPGGRQSSRLQIGRRWLAQHLGERLHEEDQRIWLLDEARQWPMAFEFGRLGRHAGKDEHGNVRRRGI